MSYIDCYGLADQTARERARTASLLLSATVDTRRKAVSQDLQRVNVVGASWAERWVCVWMWMRMLMLMRDINAS
jgi:hypothetical protein